MYIHSFPYSLLRASEVMTQAHDDLITPCRTQKTLALLRRILGVRTLDPKPYIIGLIKGDTRSLDPRP